MKNIMQKWLILGLSLSIPAVLAGCDVEEDDCEVGPCDDGGTGGSGAGEGGAGAGEGGAGGFGASGGAGGQAGGGGQGGQGGQAGGGGEGGQAGGGGSIEDDCAAACSELGVCAEELKAGCDEMVVANACATACINGNLDPSSIINSADCEGAVEAGSDLVDEVCDEGPGPDRSGVACDSEDGPGVCVNTDDFECGGTLVAGACPGGNNIQCCVDQPCEVDDGVCIDSDVCAEQGGSSSAGQCPGNANIQCCTFE